MWGSQEAPSLWKQLLGKMAPSGKNCAQLCCRKTHAVAVTLCVSELGVSPPLWRREWVLPFNGRQPLLKEAIEGPSEVSLASKMSKCKNLPNGLSRAPVSPWTG